MATYNSLLLCASIELFLSKKAYILAMLICMNFKSRRKSQRQNFLDEAEVCH